MAVETPHFSAEFTIGRHGATYVEQDSEDDVAACVSKSANEFEVTIPTALPAETALFFVITG